MATHSSEMLLTLAKRHLGLHPLIPDDAVPEVYIEELKKHAMLYSDDINYQLTLQPGKGYGLVTCLESGCNRAKIPLIRRVTTPDGGLGLGLGSLSAYRVHIVDHPLHAKSRLARVKAERQIKRESSTPQLSQLSQSAPRDNTLNLLGIVDAGVPSTYTPGGHSASMHRRSSRALVSHSLSIKSEPSETIIPRKRSFDINPVVGASDRRSMVPGELPNMSTKKVKVEVPKTPNTLPSFSVDAVTVARTHALLVSPSTDDIADIRLKLSEVQAKISSLRRSLSKVQRKAKKSRADLTRIAKMTKELGDLQALKDKYNASIPSTAVHAKPLSRANTLTNQAVASGSNVQVVAPYQQPAFVNSITVKAEPYAATSQPIPSGSGVKTESIPIKGVIQENEDWDKSLLDTQALPGDERFDQDGDFYGRGKDTFQGPVAKADDIDKFLIAAGNAEQFDGNASVDTALEKLGLPDLYHPLPGMEVALMPHQAIGVAWMLGMEKGRHSGGTLGDEMGLGKTVQMIALIAKNRSDDPLCKTTLIVAPVALLDQWQLEIEMKTNLGLKSLIYHGPNKPRKIDELRKYDIVLTTFQTLALEWPDLEAEEKKKAKKNKRKRDVFVVESDSDDHKGTRKVKKALGLLFQTKFYRVTIDEAQNIRNKRTRLSRAITKLEAKYRWCLTGTPIINGLSDAYPMLRFLEARPWNDWNEFNSHVARLEKKNPNLATIRLQAIFSTMMLRRKKESMLDGKRLIELPSKTVLLDKLQFSPEEREIYAMVETKSQEKFNRFLRAGTVLKNYHQVLVLLLRLRQICSHPALIQEGGDAFVRPEEELAGSNDKRAELARAARLVSQDFVERMKMKMKNEILERMAAEKESADATIEGEECPICYDTFTEAVVTPCTHLFCKECIMSVINGPLREDANEPRRYGPDERPCPTCRGAICKDKLFARDAFEPTDAELAGKTEDVEMVDAEVSDPKGKGKEVPVPGRALRKRKPQKRRVVDSDEEESDEDDDMSDFIVEDDEEEEEKDARRVEKKRLRKGKQRAVVISDDEMDDEIIFGAKRDVPAPTGEIKLMPRFLPSTKMKHMMQSLRTWAETHPDEKTLVISQWTQCLSLVSDYLTENGFLHVKYQGDMTRMQRDQAVRVFMSKDKATIMLMSLKCGGVGLNLTRANRVVSLDLGWSEAIESQAFDRVHRLGQTRDVTVNRLVIADTVEDRVLALQERKKALADGSLGEGNGKKVGRLSVRELANLFGLDHRGRVLAS